MFFAHLRAADGQAAQTAVVDELCREMPFRTFKRAACAGQIQRLFFPPRPGACFHPRADGFGIARRERQRRLCDDHIRVHQRAVAIGKIQTVGGIRDAPAVGKMDALDLRDDLRQFCAVSACIHQHAAADCAGNAAEFRQPAKPFVPRKRRDGCQRRARFDDQAVALAPDGVHSPGDAQHQPADAAIPH